MEPRLPTIGMGAMTSDTGRVRMAGRGLLIIFGIIKVTASSLFFYCISDDGIHILYIPVLMVGRMSIYYKKGMIIGRGKEFITDDQT